VHPTLHPEAKLRGVLHVGKLNQIFALSAQLQEKRHKLGKDAHPRPPVSGEDESFQYMRCDNLSASADTTIEETIYTPTQDKLSAFEMCPSLSELNLSCCTKSDSSSDHGTVTEYPQILYPESPRPKGPVISIPRCYRGKNTRKRTCKQGIQTSIIT